MPWNVRLQGENGKPVSDDDAVIEFNLVPESGDFRLLRYLDRYGDAYFNSLQMDDFLVEWNVLSPAANTADQWERVRKMAMQCQAEPHLYLRFIGD